MATKTRELVAMLIRNGFLLEKGRGKGSHRRFKHPSNVIVTICGHDGDDAPKYLERHVRDAISEASKKAGGVS